MDKINIPKVTKPTSPFQSVGSLVERLSDGTAQTMDADNTRRGYCPRSLLRVLRANK